MNRSSHPRLTRPQTAAGLVILALAMTACTGVESSSADAAGNTVPSSCADTAEPFSTDDAADSVEYGALTEELGPVPEPEGDVRIGSVMKFLGNQYWAALSPDFRR